jgi:hypothetical protein
MYFYKIFSKELYVHVAYIILARIQGSMSCFVIVLGLHEINQYETLIGSVELL